ncbi:MAG: hypothetical protein WC123_07495 [Bacilli bacterium]|jgi:hypothetical protein
MNYESYLNWIEGEEKPVNIMPKYEFLNWQKEKLVNNADHNQEVLKQIYNNSLPEGYKIFDQVYNSNYKLLFGAELEIEKKYHILTKINQNGLLDGISVYPDWYFTINNYNAFFYGFKGIAEGKQGNKTPYNFRFKDDDLFLIAEVKEQSQH